MKNSFSVDVERLKREMEYRNYSEKTVNSYCISMAGLERTTLKPLSEVTIADLKNYLHHALTVKQCSTSYANQHISAFKIFTEDVMQREWDGFKIKRPRRPVKMPEVLSVEEVQRMIALTANVKHRAILTIMYSAGLRRMELLQLKPADIDSERMLVKVKQGKGRKDRYTILSPKALDLLRIHYKFNKPKVYLFEPNGRPGRQVSVGTINNIVKQSVARAKITKNVSCHTLRHSFATHLLEKGVNLKLIQEFLGHTSIRTTSRYLHLTNFNPSNVHSPLEEMEI
jgi:site-specific recombinase XerD